MRLLRHRAERVLLTGPPVGDLACVLGVSAGPSAQRGVDLTFSQSVVNRICALAQFVPVILFWGRKPYLRESHYARVALEMIIV